MIVDKVWVGSSIQKTTTGFIIDALAPTEMRNLKFIYVKSPMNYSFSDWKGWSGVLTDISFLVS